MDSVQELAEGAVTDLALELVRVEALAQGLVRG